MKKCNFLKNISIAAFTALLFSTPLVAADTSKWTVAACPFDIKNNKAQTDKILESAATMFPARIMENISSSSYRTIQPDEEYERENYNLRKERISLFLQYSAQIQTRDALVLQNYSDAKLKRKIAEEEKKLSDIKTKIDKNLEAQKKALEVSEQKKLKTDVWKEKNEGQKYVELFKNLFSTKDDSIKTEKVVVYESGETNLYKPSEAVKISGLKSQRAEKEIVNAGIQALVSGTITRIGDYISVSVELLTYPGAKSYGVITEMGTLDDADYMCASIARQLSPKLTSSMPVQLNITIEPAEILASHFTRFSIDDVVYTAAEGQYIIDSGSHTITLDTPGWKTASATSYFDGNRIYNVEIKLVPLVEGELSISFQKTLFGNPIENPSVFANNVMYPPESGTNRSIIKVDGQPVLGHIILPDNSSAFYFISDKMAADGKDLFVKLNTFDRSDYIEKRRKWLYGSYSALVVSLIPYMYTYGNYHSSLVAYQNKNYADPWAAYENVNKWQTASNISGGISIACGTWFGLELVRYLLAANSVLPAEAKKMPTQKISKNNAFAKNVETDIINADTESTEDTPADFEIIEIDESVNIEEIK